MPEIRLGNIFSPPVEITTAPWTKAWAEACTGLNCEGLSRGFWNSVKILVPSVALSIAIASINGYALANWRFKGANVFFTILIFGAFIPYQVMIYPIVIILRELKLFGSLGGLVLVHTVFGMPILTLLFRNYFTSLPEELFKAARVDGAGFWGDLLPDYAAHVIAHLCGCDDFAGDRNLERLPIRGDLHQTRHVSDDGTIEQYRELCARDQRV